MDRPLLLRVLTITVCCMWQATLDAAADERPPVSWNRNAQYGFGPVQMGSFVSPSGEYSLHMDPAHGWGQYSAIYRLSSKGKVLWSEKRPYTLREIAVTDKGLVVGFAYSLLERQSSEVLDLNDHSHHYPDYFCLVIIDRDGRELLKDVKIRCLPPPFDIA